MSKKIVLVVPCFNEAGRMPTSYWRELVSLQNEISWVFVNDGSTDGTSERLKEIVSGTDARVINSKKNQGKGNAIRTGFQSALDNNGNCEIVGYVDSDGAFSKEDILRLVTLAFSIAGSEATNPVDAILSSRVALAGHEIKRKSSRHYIGRIIATFLTNGWEDAPYDTQSGFKLFRNSSSLQSALENRFKTHWFVDIELLTRIGIANRGVLDIWEEPLTSWRDVGGSKLGLRKTPKLLTEISVARREVSSLLHKRKSQHGSN